MMNNIDKWKEFWDQQKTPLHRNNSEIWYQYYAEEINLILSSSGYLGGSVLESGCGNGALFDFLDINKEKYIGVDLSETLLSIFRNKHPLLELVCADASSYYTNKKFDLIFSNGVIQYFNKAMLTSYIQNAMGMLNSDGLLLMANIPWKAQRLSYSIGELGANPESSFMNTIKTFFRIKFKKDMMGEWYDPKDFLKYKNDEIDIKFYGSLFHPYRFSVVLKKN